jgi:hypothetical protein
LTPSSSLVLQQNFDLRSTNWTDVTNVPSLDLSTLRRQVTLPSPAAQAFYRLKVL